MTSERSTLARGRPVSTTTLEPATRARRGPTPTARRSAVRRSLLGVTSDDFRPDIEGLRAVAVVVVVLFHLRIGLFSGGFVGVDVFFVLSGFLITRLLLKELGTTGGLALPNFWARRARRLLPASVLVLVVTVLAARWVMAPLALRTVATDAVAAATFVINFVFAHRMGDYFAEQAAAAQPSPLLHFWSLAVEEQFYLVWPLVLVALTRRPRQFRRLLAVVIALGILASLVTSLWMTQHHPSWAFYLLPARMGELLAGAALALAGPMFAAVPGRVRAAFGWFGLLGIAVAVLGYDATTPFPGTAAWLPVLATVLVIVAGGHAAPAHGPAAVLDNPVALWMGRHSYAIYLWHWPVLVLAEAHSGPLPLPWRVLVVGGSIGLAALSVRLIEDPVRHAPWLAVRPSRGLALGASLCAVALLAGVLAHGAMPRLASREAASAPVLELAAPEPTTVAGSVPTTTAAPSDVAPIGMAQPAATAVPSSLPSTTAMAAADAVGFAAPLPAGDLATLLDANRRVLEAGLAVTDVPSNLRPSVGSVNGDRAAIYADDCVAIGVETQITPCTYGRPGAPTTVVLYGDSHAAQWFPPLADLATERGFELVVLTKGGCPTAAVSIPTATLARTCPIWRDAAIDWIATNQPDVVIVSAWSGYPNTDDEWTSGFDATMGRLAPLTANLLVLGDNPPADVEPATCLSGHVHSVQQCTAQRADVVAQGRIDVERAVAGRYGARFIDTTDWLCAASACPIIIGDILLYRDATHLTTVATTWFAPLVAASLAGIV